MKQFYGGRKPFFWYKKHAVITAVLLFVVSLLINSGVPIRAQAPGIGHVKASETPAIVPQTITEETLVHSFDSRAASSTVNSCSTDKPYLEPALVDLSVAHDGVTVVRSPTFSYRISGQSVQEIRKAIDACSLRSSIAGSYHAITARRIDWSYGFTQTGDVCSLTNVKIGLNISQLLPDFSPTANTPQSVVDAWNTYHTNLVLHENGHVEVATRYVHELNADLNALGTMPCATLQTQAKSLIDAKLHALNTEDTLYDQQTNHGATQGAVL